MNKDKIHISLWPTDKCWKCKAYSPICNCCLIRKNENKEPPKCKDGTCNIRKVGYFK
jgi:hypothetical protein